MHDRQSLIERFAEAGLVLELAKVPMEKSNPAIFQLDIPRNLKGNTRTEWFRIWPGHEDNLLVVQNIDKKLQQLVMMVKEEKRLFTRTDHIPDRQFPRIRPKPHVGANYQGFKIVAIRDLGAKKGYEIDLQGETSANKRHYLCGVDERQLFICQLRRGCSTVADAHQSLKRTELVLAEGKAPGKTIRQGEWFFVNLTAAEEESLEAMLKERPYLIHKKEAIGPGGHPHTAEEIIRTPGKVLRHGWAIRESDIFVRGSVIHQDHAPVRFARWRKVIRNNEVGGASAPAMRNGVFWVD